MSMVHATTKGHVSVHDTAATETVLMSMTHVTSEVHRDVHSLCCHLKPCCYLRSILQGLNPSHQVCWQTPLLIKSSCQVSRNSYACVYSTNLKIQSTPHHLLLHHSNSYKEAGIHRTILRIQLKDDSNLIHINYSKCRHNFWLYYPFWHHIISNLLMPQSN